MTARIRRRGIRAAACGGLDCSPGITEVTLESNAMPQWRDDPVITGEVVAAGGPTAWAPVMPAPGPWPQAGQGTFLRVASVIMMLMTVPQVLTVWIGRDAAGVSLLCWAAYLFCACLWFVYGIHKSDKTSRLACTGWIALNATIVISAIVPH